MLTFERDKDGDQLFLHGDEDGLRLLRDSVDRLLRTTQPGHFHHDHLMSEAWGGNELSDTPKDSAHQLIHHVQVYCWKGDKPQP